jgi:hypothetical protein
MQLVNYKQITFFYNRCACQAFIQSNNQLINSNLACAVTLLAAGR